FVDGEGPFASKSNAEGAAAGEAESPQTSAFDGEEFDGEDRDDKEFSDDRDADELEARDREEPVRSAATEP
ncbi:helix-turn-helix domain-containing protein, partial [Halorubrum sp. C3]